MGNERMIDTIANEKNILFLDLLILQDLLVYISFFIVIEEKVNFFKRVLRLENYVSVSLYKLILLIILRIKILK